VGEVMGTIPIEVRVKKDEPVERALRRLDRKVRRSGVLDRFKRRKGGNGGWGEFYQKPSEIRVEKRRNSEFYREIRRDYEEATGEPYPANGFARRSF